jgi:hypothetical protein
MISRYVLNSRLTLLAKNFTLATKTLLPPEVTVYTTDVQIAMVGNPHPERKLACLIIAVGKDNSEANPGKAGA